ncbi:RadC family protein [Psychromonas antarctica]|uniref:RadC family protein n=1 Tax=Psychromonas antarctica TaxID=67573 RepID=UPI001EE7F2BF|nr:DNA repair protein RadC [Psychromonas antarctica]MCG6200031.1 DNA repair protein RadC [Psychromonas antarctica]
MHTKTNRVYTLQKPMTDHQVLEKASEILATKYFRDSAFTNAQATIDFLSYKLGKFDNEVFAIMLLDTQNQLLEYRELFYGTVDSASVYPREVVKAVMAANASAVIFAHNHPSGIAEPSEADKRITVRLKQALALIDVRVLDHIVVGKNSVSFAERGLI